MPLTQLYAWACPASFTQSPVDHTWVTAYDNRISDYPDIGDVTQAQQSYWYCWGVYHAKGNTPRLADGLLGIQQGEPVLANCVATPNEASNDSEAARGTIFLYGIHGVCHQIANQVLFATRGAGKPLTVKGCRGYWLSDFIYGTYGTNDGAWSVRANSCAVPAGAKSLTTGQIPDAFAARAAALLAGDPGTFSKLMGLREEVKAEGEAKAIGLMMPDAEAINARNWERLQEAAAVTGEQRFVQLFDHDPNHYVELVDPAMVAANG